MAVYVFCCNAQSKSHSDFLDISRYLYSINCPTVICLPSMCYLFYGETPLVNNGPRSYFHHIAITYLLYLHCLLYSHTFIVFHSIRSYPLFQANRWDWQPHRKLGTKYLVICVQVPRCSSQSKAWTRHPINCPELLRSLQASPSVVCLLFSWSTKPWFLTEGKDLLLCSSYFPLGVSQLSGHNY
jgi:hypothetical protein